MRFKSQTTREPTKQRPVSMSSCTTTLPQLKAPSTELQSHFTIFFHHHFSQHWLASARSQEFPSLCSQPCNYSGLTNKGSPLVNHFRLLILQHRYPSFQCAFCSHAGIYYHHCFLWQQCFKEQVLLSSYKGYLKHTFQSPNSRPSASSFSCLDLSTADKGNFWALCLRAAVFCCS